MRRQPVVIPILLLAVALAGCGREEPITEQAADERLPGTKQYTVETFLGTTSYGGASFSPDGSRILVHSDASGIFNLYAIPVDGSEPEQLTASTTESVFSAGYFPSDERILYRSDQGGNELDHIFVRETDGSVRDLTPGEEHRSEFYGWSHDRSMFLIGTNERDQRYMDVYAYDPQSYERTLLFQNDAGYNFGGMSPDNRYIALGLVVTNADSNIYLLDRETSETTLLTPHETEANYTAQEFAPSGHRLLYTTDADREFTYLMERDLDTDEARVLAQPDWDVVVGAYSRAGKYLLMAINNDARTELKIVDTSTGKPLVLPEVPNAEITSVSIAENERQMAFYATSARIPRDLFVQNLPLGEPNQLTRSLNPEINPAHLVDGEVVRFTSFDGLEIPGILYKPHQASISNPAPALVWVHGGPGGQSRVGYRALIQYLVNHGYVIYAINNRGSSGYGKTFFHLDDRAHGEGDLDDCVSSKGMLGATGYVDGERIGIIGGSYGGFMVLAALAFRPDAFRVGVDIFGISNWYRTVQNIPPWWESFRAALVKEMGDFDDEEYFRSISPLFHAENIVRPLMVIQGANDPRVLKHESDDIVAAARKNGVAVEYVVLDDEGHGFRKKANQARTYRAIREFLDTHLREGG